MCILPHQNMITKHSFLIVFIRKIRCNISTFSKNRNNFKNKSGNNEKIDKPLSIGELANQYENDYKVINTFFTSYYTITSA